MRAASFTLDSEDFLPAKLAENGFDHAEHLLIQIYYPQKDADAPTGLIDSIRSCSPDACIVAVPTRATLYRGSVVKERALVSVLQFEDAQIKSAWARAAPHSDGDSSYELGERLARDTITSRTRLVFCYSTGEKVNAENLAKGLTQRNPRITLAGSVSSHPDLLPLISNEQQIHHGAVVIAIDSDYIWPSIYHSNDWMMLGTHLTITDATLNHVSTINHQPAHLVYQRYLGEENKEKLNGSCVRFPLLMERNEKIIARPCSGTPCDPSVRFWGNLEQDAEVRFGIPDPVSAMDAFHQYTRQIQRDGTHALFMFPSVARKLLMRSLTEDEGRQLESLAPTAGCFSLSQYFYQPDQPDYLHYSQTILSIREGEEEKGGGFDPDTLEEFSADTLQLRTLSRLLGSTTRDLEENNRLLEKLASTDPLTQMLNRHKMQELLELELKRVQRYGRPWSVIMFDVDDFKAVNDTFGHQVGDQVLRLTAEVLKESVRDTDAVARWGGEEFLILCPETGLIGTTEIAERIQTSLAAMSFPNDLNITASLGVTTYVSPDNLDSLLQRADRALYHSKQNGRNRITCWD